MENELPYRILGVLRKLYDERPTGVLSTPEIAHVLKISVRDAQAGLIYLKEKDMINSYQDLDYKWVQKINAKGIDELKNSSNTHMENQIDPLRVDSHNLIEKFNQCISELDQLGKPLSDIEKIIMPYYTININFSKLNEVFGKIKNLLKYSFVDGNQKSEQFVRDYKDFCAQKRYVRNSFQPQKEEEAKFKSQKSWLRGSAVEFLHELKIISELQLQNFKSKEKNNSFQFPSTIPSNEKPLEFDVSHEDHTDKIKVFISHKFVESDQKLADTLRNMLERLNIYGYLAERRKEYDLGWDEKIKQEIKSSDYLVAILTKNSLYAPSVHQEIGFAIGVDVPVRIMIEEEEVKGVLAEGKDSEKFTRNGFEKYLDNIIKDVLKKGIRKKLDIKQREALNENVYVPCYNQMVNVHQNMDFIDNVPENPWKTLPANWKLNTEEDIKPLFIQYSKICDEWEKLRTDFIQNFAEKKSKLVPIILDAFRKSELIDPNGHIILDDKHTIEPHYWLEAFRMVIFDQDMVTAEELYETLYKYAKNSKNGHDKWIKQWWDSNNGVHSNILETIPELTDELRSPITKKMLDEKRTKLNESITQLILALENKTRIN